MKLYFESIKSGEVVHGYTRATIVDHIATVDDEAAIKYWQDTLAIATPVTETPIGKTHSTTDSTTAITFDADESDEVKG